MEEGINKKIEEYEYQIKLMSIFQNFLIDITKKLEIKELAENLLKFLNESFKIDKCSVIINRQRYFLGNLKDEKLIESENRIMKEVYKVSIPYIVKNLKNDTILFDLKNDSEESLLVIPIINDNKIITYVNIYDQPENIHKKDVKLINYFFITSPIISLSFFKSTFSPKTFSTEATTRSATSACEAEIFSRSPACRAPNSRSRSTAPRSKWESFSSRQSFATHRP